MSNRYSFEFFPPKTEAGREKLKDTRSQLAALNPEFFSVTYGAGGSTRDNTRGIVLETKRPAYQSRRTCLLAAMKSLRF